MLIFLLKNHWLEFMFSDKTDDLKKAIYPVYCINSGQSQFPST